MVIKYQVSQVNWLWQIVTFVILEELVFHFMGKFFVRADLFTLKYIDIDNFFLLAFLLLLCSFKSGLVNLLWRDVIEGFFNYFVHVKDFHIASATIFLLKLGSYRLFTRESATQDSKFEWQIRWDLLR